MQPSSPSSSNSLPIIYPNIIINSNNNPNPNLNPNPNHNNSNHHNSNHNNNNSNLSTNHHSNYYLSQQQQFNDFSDTNLQSINTFLNSYQTLKKLQNIVHDIRINTQKNISNNNSNSNEQNNNGSGANNLTNHNTYKQGGHQGANMLTKDSSYHNLKKKQDKISQLTKVVSKQQLSSGNHHQVYSSLNTVLKMPNDNYFVVLNSNIKCANFLTRVKTIDNKQDTNKIPMFAYPQWNQLSFEIKRIFNKIFQTPMKQLNTGTLISIKPNQSLSLRTDHYCFHPHQVYTTLLALDKSDISSGTLAFSRLSKQFIEKQFPLYNNEFQLLDSINKEKKQIQWEYFQIKEGNLIVIGKDVIYGSFRNDSPVSKFYAEMRWVRHQSASNSSNSS